MLKKLVMPGVATVVIQLGHMEIRVHRHHY